MVDLTAYKLLPNDKCRQGFDYFGFKTFVYCFHVVSIFKVLWKSTQNNSVFVKSCLNGPHHSATGRSTPSARIGSTRSWQRPRSFGQGPPTGRSVEIGTGKIWRKTFFIIILLFYFDFSYCILKDYILT